MANEAHIAQLIVRQLRENIAPSERRELEFWRDSSPSNRRFLEEETREEAMVGTVRGGVMVDKDATWRKYEALRDQHLLSQRRTPMIRRYRRFAAAAVFIALAGACAYLWSHSKQEENTPVISEPYLAVTPASSLNASLALQDGLSVQVNPAVKGRVALQGAMVTAMDDNKLVYHTDLLSYAGISDILYREDISTPGLQYNIFHAPFGTKYELMLPDGTHAVVNAGSYLKFPVTFAGGSRVVELEGEAFFDVQPDPQHPFNVLAGNKKIEVLGTQFAVRNYTDEPVQTVILQQGKVKVHHKKDVVELHPGQKAQISDDQPIKVVDVDLSKALSWKDGYFNFDDLDLRAAICQLAQWHGMKVRIEKDVRIKSLGSGNIAHSISLPRLLKLLELPDLHFEIRDSTIIVKR
ncbi:MAG: FecR domain-containing protein [Chitinophagaceae bacterium]|nr:FecR domain-containing protein [Chitinophagaceae bacterium]